MSWNVINLNAIAPMPWKNGGGTTRELVAWPQADNWLWRMSVAEIAKSGPFSRFEGVQRWFAVLSGAGAILSTDGQSRKVTPSCQPLCFDGGLATECELIDGATQDFNLMVRQANVKARMTHHRGPFGLIIESSNTVAIFIMDTRASVQFESETTEFEPATLIWRRVDKGDQVRLEVASALLIEMTQEESP